MVISPRLPEIGLLKAVVDGQGDGKQGGKEHRGQGDGQHGDAVSGFGRLHGLASQMPDAGFVGYADHVPLTPGW